MWALLRSECLTILLHDTSFSQRICFTVTHFKMGSFTELGSCFNFQAATTPSVPLSFQIEYVQLRTVMFQVHVQLERACASFKTSPPPAIATSLAMTTGEEIHKYGHVVEQVRTFVQVRCKGSFTASEFVPTHRYLSAQDVKRGGVCIVIRNQP